MPLLTVVHSLRIPNPSPRSNIPQEKQSDVDAILKGLKTCSTRLRASMSTFADELHLLERVYYKSKNQHRSSMFFKRVSDVRRYGYRLSGLQLPELVAELRAAFFGTNSKKLLKGAWNQCPDVSFVKHIALRLDASVKLLNHVSVIGTFTLHLVINYEDERTYRQRVSVSRSCGPPSSAELFFQTLGVGDAVWRICPTCVVTCWNDI
ncbi:hypothetical protein CONPUDRAFT_49102 [Coniophora puteana RWD-64-598 SS2]|uniref:Nucleolus and neural progenitor protein-like N-terminal domain-containing protein n=1 Tax=Coniophora puteana (strain RWD-64-598) TaxID=741705 RepID=A0A5M3N1E7_CONPW|nr:uncharacterized protein CONPUDRAFT_49102 [Coniophora puteana RWD-64-598 SS2]EIW85222.1 hypothetical protein CONPUDRAFT_49102 [Coniophora puteana RWD-64-598 SS2]